MRRTVDARFPARAPWVNALLLGERGDIPSASIAVLARTGLIHVMAISGLHVGIAVATLFNALRLSGLARPRTAAICLAALPALHAFVVPRPAVDRASLMAAVVLSGIVLGRRTSAFHGLALATVLLTLRDPLVTGDTGFQLSTAATAAILSVGMNGAAPNFIGRFVIGSFVVSCAAQAGVAPLLAAANHRLPLAAVPLNLVAVPAVGIAIVAAAVAVGADLVGVEHAARALAVVAGTALDTLAGVAAAVDAPGRALIVPAAVVGWMLPSALVAIGALALSVRVAARTPNGSAALLGVGLSLALLAAPAATARLIVAGDRPGPGDFRLVALDVGQGDALLVETHDQRVLVDTGGSPASNFDPGTALIAPALRARGAGSLDAVAITHFHADHAGGLRGVLAEIPTRRVWVPSSALDDASLRDSSGGGDKTRIVGLARGDAGFHGDCAWRVLHPAGGWLVAGGAPASNDGSLVMMLSCGGRRLLLTGDTEVAAESDYVSSGAGLRAQVLKSPHHGSTTSSSDMLLDAADARIAVISVGWRNRFGHPGRAVLENYRSRRMAVYRTDRDGAVTIDAGRRIRVRGERWSAGRGRPRTGGWLH